MLAHLELIEEQLKLIKDFYYLDLKERRRIDKCLLLINEILKHEKESVIINNRFICNECKTTLC